MPTSIDAASVNWSSATARSARRPFAWMPSFARKTPASSAFMSPSARKSTVAQVVERLKQHDALSYPAWSQVAPPTRQPFSTSRRTPVAASANTSVTAARRAHYLRSPVQTGRGLSSDFTLLCRPPDGKPSRRHFLQPLRLLERAAREQGTGRRIAHGCLSLKRRPRRRPTFRPT